MPATPPNAVDVDVVAARPTDGDAATIESLNRTTGSELPPVVRLVLVRLDPVPPATGSGHALYVGDFRVPKYWQYRDGIYFKVYDAQFLADHAGEPLRFSANGTEFVETGLVLPAPAPMLRADLDPGDLPEQRDLLA